MHKYYFSPENDELNLELPLDFKNCIKGLRRRRHVLEIKEYHKTKSDPMRKYYFSTVLPPFAESLGYDPDEELLLHRQLKIVFFKIKPDKRGIHRNVPSVFGEKSDKEIPIKAKFVDWVIRKAAQNGVIVPNSNGRG